MLGHVVVLCMVSLMLGLAVWQYDRLQWRKEENVKLEAAFSAEPTVVDSQARLEGIGVNTRVRLSGVTEPANTVYVRYKLLDGLPGVWVLTPLRLGDGSVVIVNQGWRSDLHANKDARPDSPGQSLTVEGLVMKTEKPVGTVDHTDGNPSIPTVRSVSSDQLTSLLGGVPVGTSFVQQQKPDGTDAVKLLPAPEITEGSHFAYVLQWTGFSFVVLIGYAILLRKAMQDDETTQVAQ